MSGDRTAAELDNGDTAWNRQFVSLNCSDGIHGDMTGVS